MPKSKKMVEPTRTRRQASKEALKQLQLLLDDDEDDAFVIPSEEDIKKEIRLEAPLASTKKRAVSPVNMESPPPKKKYKLSHRKSSDGNDRDVIVLKSISNMNYVSKENTLDMECFVEELSEVQKERLRESEFEEKELQAKLDELTKNKKADVVYSGKISSAIEVNEIVSNSENKYIFNPNELPQLGEIDEPMASSFQLVMDPRMGIIVGSITESISPEQISTTAVSKGKLQISSAVKAVATLSPGNSSSSARNMRTRKGVLSAPAIQTRTNTMTSTRSNNPGVSTRGNIPRSNNTVVRGSSQVPTTPTIQTRGMKSTTPIQTRNNKTTPNSKRTVVNAPAEKSKQVVDLTSEENQNQVDNREIAFNKLQGKTYPSLVVVARPHLRVTDLSLDRSKLDSKVKGVLMHPPAKFTEWLIQQGIVRSEQKCPVHGSTQLKLGMYSDAAKFPFSGGYVWISECCPQRFVSVFNGSIFEGSPHPPVVTLKLIYHWSCQTNIQNVTNWVKIDNLFVKGVYTWLRGICSLAVQNRIPQLGGPGVRIEVGVISLGTTSHDGNQRQVKVEVLGVMESNTKYLRLRAVEPMADGDRNFRKKFLKILEPVLHWVHPASTIVTDLTVDKVTLNLMGFANVVQTTSNDYSQSNRTIMEYLRRIVPRMFQNTLSLLSRQIIQQFLDELVWREWFGTTSQMAFDNIIAHLAEQTRLSSHPPLIIKLNKVAANPFKSWCNGNMKQQQPNSNSIQTVSSFQVPTSSATTTVVKTPMGEIKKYGRGKKSYSSQVQVFQERPNKSVSPDVPEQMVPLENYYYGTIDPVDYSQSKITLNMKCPFCKSSFDNNILLQNHLFKHAHNVSNDAYLCRYCLASVSTANELISHVNKCHPGGTKFDFGFVCLICEIHYMNPFVLGKHMSKEHIPHELPYQCGSCSYRCSNHKQVIDHFYMKHDGGSSIQCPFCLKSTTVWSSGRNVSQNIHYFIQHLQKHQKKQFAKRCGKCNLWFVQKEVLKEHQQKMHVSLRGRAGLIPFPSPRNGVLVPKSKMDKNPCDAEVINFSSLYYNIGNGSICKECNQGIISTKHFPSFDNCQNPNCQYSTCCAIAMMTHNAKCKGLNSVIPPETLPFEIFCVCGFRDSDGNSMAKHLALCEKKSAYPSEADAKTATVMHSMLDILGLVRKHEENKNETNKIEESGGDLPKLPEKMISDQIDILSDEEISNEKNVDVDQSPLENDSDVAKLFDSEYGEEEQKKSENISKDEIKEPEDMLELHVEDTNIEEVFNKSPEDVSSSNSKDSMEETDILLENKSDEVQIHMDFTENEEERNNTETEKVIEIKDTVDDESRDNTNLTEMVNEMNKNDEKNEEKEELNNILSKKQSSKQIIDCLDDSIIQDPASTSEHMESEKLNSSDRKILYDQQMETENKNIECNSNQQIGKEVIDIFSINKNDSEVKGFSEENNDEIMNFKPENSEMKNDLNEEMDPNKSDAAVAMSDETEVEQSNTTASFQNVLLKNTCDNKSFLNSSETVDFEVSVCKETIVSASEEFSDKSIKTDEIEQSEDANAKTEKDMATEKSTKQSNDSFLKEDYEGSGSEILNKSVLKLSENVEETSFNDTLPDDMPENSHSIDKSKALETE